MLLNIDYFEEKCYINKVQNIGPLVKRLRRSPLKAESWVRFPYGSPNIKMIEYQGLKEKLDTLFLYLSTWRL